MKLFGFLSARFRGFRIVNLLGATIFIVIAVGSYALKTLAGAQDAGAATIEDQVVQEEKRIRMLRIEIAHLEAPERIADLSRRYLNMGPPDVRREITVKSLAAIAGPTPTVPVPTAPAQTPEAPVQ
jgi:hypothetical protein